MPSSQKVPANMHVRKYYQSFLSKQISSAHVPRYQGRPSFIVCDSAIRALKIDITNRPTHNHFTPHSWTLIRAGVCYNKYEIHFKEITSVSITWWWIKRCDCWYSQSVGLFIYFFCGLIVMNIKSELTSVSRYQRAAHSKRKKYCSLQTVIDVRSLK